MRRDNLPLDNGVIFMTSQLPEDIRACNSEQGTTHIVRGWEYYDDNMAMGLCGNWAKFEITEDEIPLHWFCESCLQSLNNLMEGYMYDSENNQYYDPVKR